MSSSASRRGTDDQAATAAVAKLFDDTRKRLVETGTRNRLVHVNRANTRGNVLNIVNERADNVYAFLSSGKAMRFLAIGTDKKEEPGDIVFADAGEEGFEPGRYDDAQLETRLGPNALQKKVLKIAREAQTAEEESGVNILYLSLGYLTWFEDKTSAVPREAPLVLLPVELVRNARTSTYDIRMRDEDVLTNLPLKQRLRDDFGIELPDLEPGEAWRPADYFASVQVAIEQRRGWKIEPDAIQLGFFSFNKQLMYLDLDLGSWAGSALADHALTRGLLYEGFEGEESLFGPSDRLDEVLPPEKLFHVVDADASQAKVIEEVRAGRNLVVQGPPGTGKSQTITNIIAAAAREGKRVLFLAEKMAALSVVHDRLVKVGLRDICLELHSRTASKKIVLAELARTLAKAGGGTDVPEPTRLKAVRDRLNDLDAALHRPIGASGETPFTVLGRQCRYISAGATPPSLRAASLVGLTLGDEGGLLQAVDRYGELLTRRDPAEANPFEGVRNLDLQPVDLARLARTLMAASAALAELAAAVAEPLRALAVERGASLAISGSLADLLGRLGGKPGSASETAAAIMAVPDLTRLVEVLSAGAAWREARDRFEGTFVEAAFRKEAAALRAPLIAGARSVFARWGGKYRAASRELAALLREAPPKSAAERVKLVDSLLDLAAKREAWEADRDYGSRVLSDAWRAERTDFAGLLHFAHWCDRLSAAELRAPTAPLLELAGRPDVLTSMIARLREAMPAGRSALEEAVALLDLAPTALDRATLGADGLEGADLDGLARRFSAMAASIDGYAAYANLERLRCALAAAGLAELAERMRSGELDTAAARVELRFARAEALWNNALARDPVLRELATERRHDLVSAFASLERNRMKENVDGIVAGHLAQVPKGAMGEMGVIRGEIGKRTRHIALRRLFEKAGTAIQRIKPVLLMSPVSVAQFLPPDKAEFDLLVIDEASQVRPEDALGAIARAKQIVVVGDEKQLPPTSFFDRVAADDEEEREDDDLLAGAAQVGEMESILKLCEARGLGSRMLCWHYRSRDPSLIEVSNREFYNNELILPPSPLQEDPAYGLCFTRVNGVYDRGGKRDNKGEGEAIVARVADHARLHPTLSLGVVTFSFAQRNLITLLLEQARRADATLDAFMREGQSEDMFVKNIENVQGDERDVILVSVGYGPSVKGGGLTSMSFGPVNGEGGERRLNVLFTRARVRCEIFCSFDPGNIDLARTSGEGLRIFKRFLEYAKSGRIEVSSPTGLEADSPFEEDVADVVRSFGYLADPQVGSAGFRIDLGIRHPDKPGTYILAVECDGAAYHSALWARERDRLRQDVLEHLGWRVYRIWSTDWFYNRKVEIERLRQALFAARDVEEAGVRISGANTTVPKVSEEPETQTITIPDAVERRMPAYQRAVFPVRSPVEPHEAPVAVLADLAGRIVAAEGPIHVEEIARRIAASFGKDKAGSRILAAARQALLRAQSVDPNLLSEGEFWFKRAQRDAPPVRDRSAESGATLKAASISMLEIRAALAQAHADNAGGSVADLVRTAARLLGFRRVGSDLQERLSSGLDTSL